MKESWEIDLEDRQAAEDATEALIDIAFSSLRDEVPALKEAVDRFPDSVSTESQFNEVKNLFDAIYSGIGKIWDSQALEDPSLEEEIDALLLTFENKVGKGEA